MRPRREDRSLAADLLLGAFAGAVSNWVLTNTTSLMYEHEDPKAKKRETKLRRNKTASQLTAEKIAKAAGKRLSPKDAKKYGELIHLGTGVAAGAVYGLMWHSLRSFRLGSGVGFGLLFWLVVDEGANTVFGITPPPRNFPWQAHARGLAGHLIWGLTAEALFHLSSIGDS